MWPGQPVTAHDAAWTIETQGLPEVASPRQDYSREIREVVVEDDSTLVIHSREDQRVALMRQIPLARLGTPQDVAAIVAFLASPAASYITGSTLHVNGGMYMD